MAGDIVPIASKATSGDKGKFEASVKGFVIGAVPDRGGRPTEGRAAQAAANMPQWKPRSAAGMSHQYAHLHIGVTRPSLDLECLAHIALVAHVTPCQAGSVPGGKFYRCHAWKLALPTSTLPAFFCAVRSHA